MRLVSGTPWRTSRDTAVDVVLVLSLLAWGQAEVWGGGAEVLHGPEWANALVFAVLSGLLIARRRHPQRVLALQCAAMIMLIVLVGGTSQSLGWVLPVAAGVYAVGVSGRPHGARVAVGFTGALLLTSVAIDAVATDEDATDVLGAVPFLGLLVGTWLVAGYVRTRRLLVDELARSAELEALAREERAVRVATAQRTQIARELHDVLAHGLTLTVRQAEAGEARLDTNPDAARESLLAIADAGRKALVDVRRLMTLLREPSHHGASPDLAEAVDLVRAVAGTGLAVEMHGLSDVGDVPAQVSATAYRVVQEGLTNVLRHSDATRVWVTLRRDTHCLEVVVADDGHGVVDSLVPGRGLTGLRERTCDCGGELIVRRSVAGGVEIAAYLGWQEPAT